MKALFDDVGLLDYRLVDEFNLSEDLMMEHAANSLNLWVRKKLKKGKKVQILCGCGNNGADGLACARMLHEDYKVSVLLPLGVKSNMCKLQLKRLEKLNVKIDKKVKNAHLYIDAIFGSGLTRELGDDILSILQKANAKKGLKLACDMPTGVMKSGEVIKNAFMAQKTISMGALKIGLFGDLAKDFVGDVSVCDLGVSRKIYETKTSDFVLEKKDLKLPIRAKQNVNKGSFGHLVVVSGEKKGASLLTAKAGFYFGAGLVSVLGGNKVPNYLMSCEKLPKNTTALAMGMGLGKLEEKYMDLALNANLPILLDADILHSSKLKEILEKNSNLVLTPHPKEFSVMLKNLDMGDFSVKEIQAKRFDLARKFSTKFPQVLVLKGANTIIAKNGKLFVSPFGSSALAKGGSGDVLSGLIASLLAQGYNPLNSAISGVLAHGLSVDKMKTNDYSLSPNDIINKIKSL